MRKPSELTKNFHDPVAPIGVEHWLQIGAEIQNLWDLPELVTYITSPYNGIIPFLTGDLPQEDDFDALKEKILVNVVAERVSYYYHKEKTVMGKKDDRVKKFFAALTEEPQDFYEMLEDFGLSENTVKNFKRNDHLRHIGKPKRKKNKSTGITTIWREPQTIKDYESELLKSFSDSNDLTKS